MADRKFAPPNEVLAPATEALADARHKRGRWATTEGDYVTDMVAIALANVPDGWAKVNGRWVQLERPILRKNAYDLIEADWATLNEALADGRIRILPEGVNCVCDPSTGAVCGLHGRDGAQQPFAALDGPNSDGKGVDE